MYAKNVRTSSATKKGTLESTLGNQLLSTYNTLLPDGINKCVGTASNGQVLAIFNYNSDGQHGIYTYTYRTQAFGQVLVWSGLNFTSSTSIIGASLIDSILTWVDDSQEPKSINISKDNSQITPLSITLIKLPPTNRITADRVTNGTTKNIVGKTSFQFTYRFIYRDNEKSVFAPFSDLYPADVVHNPDNTLNAYELFYTVRSEVLPYVKAVEVAIRRNGGSSLEIIHRDENPKPGNTHIFKDNQNTYAVSPQEASEAFEPVPRAKCHTHFKGRHWLANTSIGYDVKNISISITLLPKSTNEKYNIVKPRSKHEIGVVLYDEYLRSTGVIHSEPFEMFDYTATSEDFRGFTFKQKYRIQADVRLSNLPPWARYMSLVSTTSKDCSVYVQVPVNYFFYLGEYRSDDANFVPPPGTTAIEGKVFLTDKPTSRSSFQYMYLQVPDNIAITPETDMVVRVISEEVRNAQTAPLREEPILRVEGNWIVVNDFNIKSFANLPRTVLIEIKKPPVSDELFYETGELWSIPENQTTFNRVTTIKGDDYAIDTHRILNPTTDLTPQATRFIFSEKVKDDSSYSDIVYPLVDSFSPQIFSPTPTYSNIPVSSSEVEQTTIVRENTFLRTLDTVLSSFNPFNSLLRDRVEDDIVDTSYRYEFKASTGYVLDYTKIASSKGRANVKIYDERKIDAPTEIVFSGRFVPGSRINNLSNFSILDKEVLSIERSPITKLQVAGDVLLAIHETTTTSIYVGEGFIRQNQDAILAKTERVIGDDRELVGGYGTLHPESVCEYQGQVFWWDSLNGTVCRYTKAGLYPVSNYKMKEYFLAKAQLYDDMKVLGAIDPDNKQYLIHFPATGSLAPETLAFNIETETWESWYSHDKSGQSPDRYAYIGTELMSFMDGVAYKHNAGEYLNFYGEAKDRLIKWSVSPAPNQNKHFLNIHLRSDDIGSYDDEERVLVYSTERGQDSYAPFVDLTYEEGVYYAPVNKDTNSNIDANLIPLRDGAELVDDVMDVEFKVRGNIRANLYQMVVVFVLSHYTR